MPHAADDVVEDAEEERRGTEVRGGQGGANIYLTEDIGC